VLKRRLKIPQVDTPNTAPAIGSSGLFDMMPMKNLRKSARMYRAVTRQIEVTVEPNFLPERSSAERCEFFWSYTIVITNTGEETVQLRTRHWIITDARAGSRSPRRRRGRRAAGARAGERFKYTSGVPLPTASGFMTGRYQMVSESGERFEIGRTDVFTRQSRQQAGAELADPCFSSSRLKAGTTESCPTPPARAAIQPRQIVIIVLRRLRAHDRIAMRACSPEG